MIWEERNMDEQNAIGSVISEKKTEKMNQNPVMQEREFDMENLKFSAEELDEQEEKRASARKKLEKMNLSLDVKIPESYIDSAGFSSAFNSQLGSKKRSFKSWIFSGSRLHTKASCASKLKDIEMEQLKRKAKKRKQSITIDEFLKIDVSGLKLTSDQEFTNSARKLAKIGEKTELMQNMYVNQIKDNPAIDEEKKQEIARKLEHLHRLNGYYIARKKLIKNEYYMTHYNSELSYYQAKKRVWVPDDKAPKWEIQRKKEIRERDEVSDLIRGVECASYLLRHGSMNKDEAKADFENLYKKKLSDKSRLALFDCYATRSNYMAPGYMHGIGYMLQFVNWMWRGKRKTDYGEQEYDKSLAKYEKLPEAIRNGQPLVKPTRGMAPEVPLEKYFQDSVKSELSRLQKNAPRPDADDDDDYKGAFEALEKWTHVRGIVNLDTVRMEMSFADRFIKASKRWLQAHQNGENHDYMTVRLRYNFLKAANEQIEMNMYGGLKNDMDPREFEMLKANAEVISEDTTYAKNVEESNVKDIPLFLHQPNINDVKQAFVGDCWLHSAVQAVVANDPKNITRMFSDLKDGTVLVRLYKLTDSHHETFSNVNFASTDSVHKYEAVPVYVRLRKDFEEDNGSANDCLWMQLIERAVAVSGVSGHIFSKVQNGKLTNTNAEITCGSDLQGMTILTGKIYEHKKPTEVTNLDLKLGDPKAKYYMYCKGLHADVRDKVLDRIMKEDQKREKYVSDDTIIAYAEEEQREYLTNCNELCREFDNLAASLNQDEFSKNLNSITDLSTFSEKFKTSLGTEYASMNAEEVVRQNIRDIDGFENPKFTLADAPGLRGFAEKAKTKLTQIKNALHKKNKDELVTLTDDMAQMITITHEVAKPKKARQKIIIRDAGGEITAKSNISPSLINKMTRMHRFKLKYDMSNYTKEQTESILQMMDDLHKNGALAACFGMHCMTFLDMKYKDGHWFVLVRDPFNLYNRSYTKKNGKLSGKSEGFGRVFNMNLYDKKRHLTDNEDDSKMRAGFRGLSWWTFEDIYKECENYAVLKTK